MDKSHHCPNSLLHRSTLFLLIAILTAVTTTKCDLLANISDQENNKQIAKAAHKIKWKIYLNVSFSFTPIYLSTYFKQLQKRNSVYNSKITAALLKL